MSAPLPPPVPAKVRPSWWWFVLGGGLLVAAVASGIGLFVWTLSSFLATDVSVPADGAPHEVSVATDGDRMLWYDAAAPDPSCTVLDRATGSTLAVSAVTGTFTRNDGDGDRVGSGTFDPGSGDLTITCTAPTASEVEIGPAPSLGSFGLGLLLTIAVPLVLGGLGLVVLLVTGILWSTRATTRR